MFPPDRIVCLTEETVETLYLLQRAENRQLARHKVSQIRIGAPLAGGWSSPPSSRLHAPFLGSKMKKSAPLISSEAHIARCFATVKSIEKTVEYEYRPGGFDAIEPLTNLGIC